MKRFVAILFIVFCAVFWGRAFEFSPGVEAQRKRPATGPNYSKFQHKTHKGKVKSLTNKTLTADLDCAYCHGSATKDKLGAGQHDLEIVGYPSHKNGLKDTKTHSACIDCHAFTGAGTKLEMCVICHTGTSFDQKVMATNIRQLPNPDGGGISQFYDGFSHGSHVDYYEQYATQTPLKERIKFYDAKADAKANKGLDKNRFECAACHSMNTAPVTVAKINFATGVKMSAPSHPDCFVCHLDPKIVSSPKPNKPDPKNTFATNCIGCHAETAKPPKDNRPVAGSELAVHWFARQIVNTELNPPKAGAKSPLPFSHKTHDDAIGKTVADCLSCHATGKTANSLKDFYLEDRKTKEKQPLALGCVDCHKKDGMQTKIEGAVTLETSKCNYCHSLATIKQFAAKGVALPPPSHFGKKAIQAVAQTTTTPTTPTAEPPKPTPAPTPTPTPVAPKPTPTPTPVAPTQKPQQTATPTPAPTGNPATNPAPTTTPTPPKPTPAPTPAPAQQTTSTPAPSAAGGTAKPAPTGIIRLGDPKESPHWGQHNKWGVVENFDHGTHIKPTYSGSCQDCHHTNKDSRVEVVLKCVTCHKEVGHPDTDSKGGGVNVEEAYHGISGSTNTKIKAGCIECHKTFRDEKKADTKAPISPCSACHTEKQAGIDWRRLNRSGNRNNLALRRWISDFRPAANQPKNQSNRR
ncbi:MAG: cytochrome c3 family protein [Acidobacteria bacterium]|nr:cytochrome c3 family protein [Acidobacteriota bacterium]